MSDFAIVFAVASVTLMMLYNDSRRHSGEEASALFAFVLALVCLASALAVEVLS